jgi:glutathione-regulated potassium-efflux system ancillary protein KefC
MQELIWVGTAFFSGLVAARFTLPPLVGYLAAGYALHAFQAQPLSGLPHLADIGIQLLLFTVGLKIKPRSLIRREVLSVGGLHVLLMALVSACGFFLLNKHITGGLVLGISLAFSSTVFAIKVLEDNGEWSSLHGRDVLSILILQDVVAVALLAFTEGRQPSVWVVLLLLLPLLRPWAHRLLSVSRQDELVLLLGVGLALAGGVLAEQLGVTGDIGALLIGVTLANHAKTDQLAQKLWGLKELFLVAFFLQIGLTDLPDQHQLYWALILLVLLPVQGMMFFALFLISGLRTRTAFVSSLALMTYSEFALITTTAVIKAQLLTPEWQAIISLAVAGSLAIAAPLNRFSHTLYGLCEPILARFDQQSRATTCDRLPDSFGSVRWLILGMGRTGQAAYCSLENAGQPVFGLDADPTVVEQLQSEGCQLAYADVADAALWEHLPLQRLNGIILALPSFNNRLNAIMQLRKRKFSGRIGAICYQADDERLLLRQGANFVIHPLNEAGNQLAKQMLTTPSTAAS